MKPLKHPPEYEGDDSINTPPDLDTTITESDLVDTRDLDEDDAEDDDDE